MQIKSLHLAGLAFALLVAAGAAAAMPQAGEPKKAPTDRAMKPIASVREVMETITIPTSDAIFAAGAEAPKDDAGWTRVREQALVLAESSNLLMLSGRAPDAGAWNEFSVAQRDASVAVLEAVKARDGDKLSSAADALYETCANCHAKYLPK